MTEACLPIRYLGPAFYDMNIIYSVPSCREGGYLSEPGAAAVSAGRFYRLEPRLLTGDQAHQLLSVRDYAKALIAEFYSDAPAVFQDFLSRPLTALVLADVDLTKQVITTMERNFKYSKSGEINVKRTKVLEPVGELLLQITDIMKQHGWNNATIRDCLRGRPRPQF